MQRVWPVHYMTKALVTASDEHIFQWDKEKLEKHV
jgi:hypothetical protein